MCVYVHTCVGVRSFGPGVPDLVLVSSECQEGKSDLLKEWQVLLTNEPSFRL